MIKSRNSGRANTIIFVLPVVAFLVLTVGAYVIMILVNRHEPPVSFVDEQLNPKADELMRLASDPLFGVEIATPTGQREAVTGYVGLILIQDGDKGPWRPVGNQRPQPDQIAVVPSEDDILYEGIVTSKLNAGGSFTAFTAELKLDEAAEVIIRNDLFVSYKDPTMIPWDALRRVPLEANKSYFFVEGAVLSTITFRKYRKLESISELKGTAFGANGAVYVASEGFKTQRRLGLRTYDLRLLRSTEGGEDPGELGKLLRQESLEIGDAAKLNQILQDQSLNKARLQLEGDSVKFDASTTSYRLDESLELNIRLGGVPHLQQVKSNGCWATVAAMLYGWRAGTVVTPEEFLATECAAWLTSYTDDRGLATEDKEAFLNDAGLTFEYGASYLPEAIQGMLDEYGPLWFTVGTAEGYSTHATVVIGLFGFEDKVYVTYIDPKDGLEYDEEYAAFMGRYEQPAHLYNKDKYYRKQYLEGNFQPIHVVHNVGGIPSFLDRRPAPVREIALGVGAFGDKLMLEVNRQFRIPQWQGFWYQTESET